jgi:hypothetical protein
MPDIHDLDIATLLTIRNDIRGNNKPAAAGCRRTGANPRVLGQHTSSRSYTLAQTSDRGWMNVSQIGEFGMQPSSCSRREDDAWH